MYELSINMDVRIFTGRKPGQESAEILARREAVRNLAQVAPLKIPLARHPLPAPTPSRQASPDSAPRAAR